MASRKGGDRRARVALAYPVTAGRRRIAALVVAPPTLDDLVRLRASDPSDPRALVSVLTGEPPEVVGLIRWTDAERVLEVGLPMLPPDLAVEAADGEAISADDLDDDPDGADAPRQDAEGERPAFAPAPASEDDPPTMDDFLYRSKGLTLG